MQREARLASWLGFGAVKACCRHPGLAFELSGYVGGILAGPYCRHDMSGQGIAMRSHMPIGVVGQG